MVSKASDDLPDPDSPVKTIRALRGRSRWTFFRLCSRAPRTTRRSVTLRVSLPLCQGGSSNRPRSLYAATRQRLFPVVAPLARSAPGAGTITAGRPSPWHGTQGFEEAGYGRLRPRPRRPGRSPASLPRGAAAGDQAVGRPL